MKTRTLSLTGVACVLALAALPAAAGDTKPVQSGEVALDTATMSATVEAVDVAKRLLTLRGPDGNVQTVEVEEAVQNLPQLKKGDQIVAVYYESLGYAVRKAGTASPGVAVAGAAAAAKPGAKPGGGVARQVTATVTITAIDPKAPSVTMKGPKGNVKTVKIRDPKNLEGVQVGDLVDLTYTEALAIKLEKKVK